MAIIFGKPIYGRLETLQYANKKFNWSDKWVIGISQSYALKAWIYARLTGRKVCYYCIDFYSPEIAENAWDGVWIKCAMIADWWLCRHCDKIWDISERINEGRKEYGIPRIKTIKINNITAILKFVPKSEIVPLSYPPDIFKFSRKNDLGCCIFVGLVPYGKEIFPKKTLWLSGSLKNLPYYKIGLALWEKKGNNYYGDPGKTKLYSACGLPVITTDNSPYAEIIRKTEAGIVVRYSKRDVERAVRRILRNYTFYKNNVKKTWKYINADRVFKEVKL